VISNFKIRTIAIKSNSDTGGKIINNVLKGYAEKNSFFNLYDNIPYVEYLSLLKYTSLLIGNSSSGIIEAPTFKIPVINIGNRQRNRIRASNIIDVSFDTFSIENAINRALNDKKYRDTLAGVKNPYGTGRSGEKIVKILNKFDNKEKLIQKYFYD
jgi:UDP-N-acetylglucosamine 2-epimerase (non-hydrolysing)/GDP/UDP-N,N'-diacetylbacillosamine 2-epimerase (hydrolysing)